MIISLGHLREKKWALLWERPAPRITFGHLSTASYPGTPSSTMAPLSVRARCPKCRPAMSSVQVVRYKTWHWRHLFFSSFPAIKPLAPATRVVTTPINFRQAETGQWRDTEAVSCHCVCSSERAILRTNCADWHHLHVVVRHSGKISLLYIHTDIWALTGVGCGIGAAIVWHWCGSEERLGTWLKLVQSSRVCLCTDTRLQMCRIRLRGWRI